MNYRLESRDLSIRIAELSPERRKLLALQVNRRGGEFNCFPLSFAQQRVWFLDQLEPGTPAYNVPAAMRLKGPLNVAALEQSINEVVRRHEVLRATFAAVDGRPVQVIAPTVTLRLAAEDVPAVAEAEREGAVLRLASAEAQCPFDLTRAPLVRVRLLRLGPQEHVAFLTMHHIVSDAWSMGVVIRELATLYEAFSSGKPSPLPELPIQYVDFAVWQQQWLQGEVLAGQLAYWKQRLAGLPVLDLPTDRARPAVQSFRGARQCFVLPASLYEGLKALSQREGATLFMTLLAAFKILLHRYTGQDDIVVGAPIANRNRAEIEGLIGFFVNTLVLRTDVSGNPTVRELMGRVREVCLGAYAHQDLPFEKLVEELHPERDLSRNPLVQVLFVLQNVPMPTLELAGLRLQPVDADSGTAQFVDSGTVQFDVEFQLWEGPEGLKGCLQYNTDLFDAPTLRRLVGHWQRVLEGMVADAEQRIATVELLTAAERQQLVVEWNATQAEYPRAQCMQQLFEAQVERTPGAVAVVCGARQLCYRELNHRANRLARLLVQQGVGPDVVVALLGERGIDLLTAIMAVFKAGGAYLPLDPRHPAERLLQVLRQSGFPLVLAAREFVPALSQAIVSIPRGKRPLVLQIEQLLQPEQAEENLAARCTPSNIAYVIYTSGSTGIPKGAMIEHGGMLNHLYSKIIELGLTNKDTVAQTASQCFDVSVWQFLAPLLVGGCVDILNFEDAHDPSRLLDQVQRRCICILETVPSLLAAMLQEVALREPVRPDLPLLRSLVLTGEALPPRLCREWLNYYPKVRLLNAYGPTECSDDVAHYPIYRSPAADMIRMPIGRPIANTRLYVLDQLRQPVPIGVTGELYVGGIGVGRGYLNDSERTTEVFVPDPFAEEPGARLYRTGDLALYRPDGNIEFLGRLDHQVKIRGFRIEPGEIEAVLSQYPGVKEAVVVAREDEPGQKRLVAYIVAHHDDNLTLVELRSFLKQKLPEYMVPAAFVPLAALPLTPNGKVDRRALPRPDRTRPELDGTFVAPRTPTEEVLAGIWAQILGLERVGIHDNFFALGGHSLMATQIISRVHDAFKVELPVRSIFELPTIAELSQAIEKAKDSGGRCQTPAIVPVSREAHRVKRAALLTEKDWQSLSG